MTVPYSVVALLLMLFAAVAALVLARARRRGQAETERLDDAIQASRTAREDERWRDAYAPLASLRPPPPPPTS